VKKHIFKSDNVNNRFKGFGVFLMPSEWDLPAPQQLDGGLPTPSV